MSLSYAKRTTRFLPKKGNYSSAEESYGTGESFPPGNFIGYIPSFVGYTKILDS